MAVGVTATSWASSHKMKANSSIPPEITTPDTVKAPIGTLKFFDGVPTDVGDVSYSTPTMGAIIISWPLNIPPHQWGCTASNGMSIGRKGAIKAAHVLAATGLDLFTDAELLTAARAEFDERTGGKPYQCLCELDDPIGGHRPEHHEGHDQALMGVSGMVDNKQKNEG
jgi:hypothetical protein